MSVRLNVLLVQSSRMSGLQSGINADLVFQLMGVPGVDLSIVNSLNPAEIAETDRLLLSSFQNDLAVLDWRDVDDSLAALAILGVSGARAPHQLDPTTPAVQTGTRRIYLVDLRSGDSPAAVVSAMKQLLDQRRVVAVPLIIGGMAKPKMHSATNPVSPPSIVAPPSPTPQPTKAPTVVAHTPHLDGGHASVRREPSDRDLDALVDGLNSGDW
jgi:hypothetical protein